MSIRNIIFILLYRMPPISYTTSVLCYYIYAPSDIFNECRPLQWRCQECHDDPPLVSKFEPYAHIFLMSTLLTTSLVKSVGHSKDVVRSVYQSDQKKTNTREKRRDMTQSYDKIPCTHRKIQKAKRQHKNATKTITQRLRTAIGRSVGVTIATLLVWLWYNNIFS